MSSKLEQTIDEIQDLIDSCKYSTFSSTKILVNKEEIDDLLHKLKSHTPEEIKMYQKVISNKEAIMSDAERRAQDMISQAQAYTDQMVNEHTIMQQAYQQAGEIVNMAKLQAQEIIDTAVRQANEIQFSAMQYTDETLATLQQLLSGAITVTHEHDTSMIRNLSDILNSVNMNRAELHPEDELVIASKAEAERNMQLQQNEAMQAASGAVSQAQSQVAQPYEGAEAPVKEEDTADDLNAPL